MEKLQCPPKQACPYSAQAERKGQQHNSVNWLSFQLAGGEPHTGGCSNGGLLKIARGFSAYNRAVVRQARSINHHLHSYFSLNIHTPCFCRVLWLHAPCDARAFVQTITFIGIKAPDISALRSGGRCLRRCLRR